MQVCVRYIALVLGAAACNPDTGFSDVTPRVAVAPSTLDFGSQTVPLEREETLYVTNNGQAQAEVVLSVAGDGSVFSIEEGAVSIAVGETLEIPVRFLPETYLVYSGEIQLESNDETNPLLSVPLAGEGVYAPTPDICVEPMTVDFGDVDSDALETLYFNVSNCGDAVLSVGTVVQTGSGAFSLLTDPSNSLVGPSSSVPVVVAYAPSTTTGDDAWLTIPSDDPDEDMVEVLLLGNGGAEVEYPVAEIDCPGTSAPPEFVRLDGSGSYDPEGHLPLEFEWQIVDRPAGSQGELDSQYTSETNLFTDTAGTYEVHLIIENSIGTRSSPAKCLIDAIPSDELHVELTWDTSQADLDLHLLEEGAAFFQKPGDCNWCNVNPKWGDPGTGDDPRLDLDDQYGYGPENINVEVPANGQYSVMVQFFDDNGDTAVIATVRIYTMKELTPVFTGSKVLYRDEVWDVGRVNWPEATVAPIDTVTEGLERICWE